MGAKLRRRKQEHHGNIFWVTLTDLFIGMFMIFATLFFAFCANTGQGLSAVVAQTTQQVTEKIIKEMGKQDINVVAQPEKVDREEVKYDKKVDVEIDPFTGMAKISDLELFKLNSAELTPAGRTFLSKFIPVYLDSIFESELKKYVMYVVIQGHTDSHLFIGSYTPQQQYMKNMNLSMNRAYNVAEFLFQITKNKPYYKDLTHIIRVEGASFSKPIMVNGKEDYKQSRRVELRLVLKEEKFDVLQQFLRRGAGNGVQSYEKL